MRTGHDAAGEGKAPLFHAPDTVIAGIILVGAAVLYYLTTRFETVPQLLAQNIGPELFPQLVLMVIVVMAIGLPIEHHFLRGGRARLDSGRRERVRAPTWITAILMTAIVALMPVVGTLVTMFLACLSLPPLWGDFRLRLVLPFAILFPIAVKLVFEDLLAVHFEPGLWARLFE